MIYSIPIAILRTRSKQNFTIYEFHFLCITLNDWHSILNHFVRAVLLLRCSLLKIYFVVVVSLFSKIVILCIISCPILSCPTQFNSVFFCPILFCPVSSNVVQSSPIQFCTFNLVFSCLVHSYQIPVQSFQTLYFLTRSCIGGLCG